LRQCYDERDPVDVTVSGAVHPKLEFVGYAEGPAAEAWGLIAEIFFNYGRPRAMSIGQELDLSPPQGLVLRLLDQPRRMGELAAMMHCDNSNMTGIVDRLEERGLVQRVAAAKDRRVKLIEVTERGNELREEQHRRMAEPPPLLANLSDDDQVALRDLLRRALDGG
jgi:DNA-binding MarR family transcriptional regulator